MAYFFVYSLFDFKSKIENKEEVLQTSLNSVITCWMKITLYFTYFMDENENEEENGIPAF